MKPVPVEPAPDLNILNCLLFLDWCSAFSMRVRAGLASAQLTFFTGFRAAGGAANRQLFLRGDFHPKHSAPSCAKSLVNCDQYAIHFR
jgi:hypothetical protein